MPTREIYVWRSADYTHAYTYVDTLSDSVKYFAQPFLASLIEEVLKFWHINM